MPGRKTTKLDERLRNVHRALRTKEIGTRVLISFTQGINLPKGGRDIVKMFRAGNLMSTDGLIRRGGQMFIPTDGHISWSEEEPDEISQCTGPIYEWRDSMFELDNPFEVVSGRKSVRIDFDHACAQVWTGKRVLPWIEYHTPQVYKECQSFLNW